MLVLITRQEYMSLVILPLPSPDPDPYSCFLDLPEQDITYHNICMRARKHADASCLGVYAEHTGGWALGHVDGDRRIRSMTMLMLMQLMRMETKQVKIILQVQVQVHEGVF